MNALLWQGISSFRRDLAGGLESQSCDVCGRWDESNLDEMFLSMAPLSRHASL